MHLRWSELKQSIIDWRYTQNYSYVYNCSNEAYSELKLFYCTTHSATCIANELIKIIKCATYDFSCVRIKYLSIILLLNIGQHVQVRSMFLLDVRIVNSKWKRCFSHYKWINGCDNCKPFFATCNLPHLSVIQWVIRFINSELYFGFPKVYLRTFWPLNRLVSK